MHTDYQTIGKVIRFIANREDVTRVQIMKEFHFGFAKTEHIMDELEWMGLIAPKDGTNPRKVLLAQP